MAGPTGRNPEESSGCWECPGAWPGWWSHGCLQHKNSSNRLGSMCLLEPQLNKILFGFVLFWLFLILRAEGDTETARVPANTLWHHQTAWKLPFTRQVVSDSLQLHGLQHARLLCPTLSPGVCSNSCLLSRWCYLTISSSAASFYAYVCSVYIVYI